jgi:hypothetical protein
MTNRERHIEAFKMGLIDPSTPMGSHWERCAERTAKTQREVVANATKSTKPSNKVRKVEAKA